MFDMAPEEWGPTTLGAIAMLGGGTTPSTSEAAYWEGGSVPWATPSDITRLPKGKSGISQTEIAVTDRALRECSLPLNSPGTVLMTSRATIGYAAINDVPMATNQGFITFRCKETVDPHFLLQWLVAKRDFLVAAAGGSTFKELSRGTAKLLPIFLPPIEEQRRIAEVLSSVDRAIAAQSEVCDQTEITFNSLADACFAAGNEAAENIWPIYALGDLCESIQVGIVIRPASYYVETGGIPALRSLNIGENRLNLDDLVYISAEGQRLNNKSSLRPGDVVTRRTGEPGKTAVIPPLFPDGLNCIDIIFSRPTGNLRAHFLSFFMNSDVAKRQVAGLQGGLAQQHLNVGEMKKLRVPLPTPHVQDEVVATLKSAWDRVEGEKALLDRLLSLRSAIGVDLLSGRVRVPT
jgi:type I restriction enzyme, S subunit